MTFCRLHFQTYFLYIKFLYFDSNCSDCEGHIDNKSSVVQVMAWCCQAASHYLTQCWSRSAIPYGATRLQWVNSLWPSDTIWREIWVNIGSGNVLLPDGTKPLPEPKLTDHQWSPVTFILGQFHKSCLNHQSLNLLKNYISKFHSNFPGANELTHWSLDKMLTILTRRSENDNTPQPLDQWTNSPFMGQQVGNCKSFTLTHYLAELCAMHYDPRASPSWIGHCIQLASLLFQVDQPSHS